MKVRLTGNWELADEEFPDKISVLISRDKPERATYRDVVSVPMPAYKFVGQILASSPGFGNAARTLMEAFFELGRRAETTGKS